MKRLHYNSKKICCVRQDGLRSIYFYALIQYTCQLGTTLDLFHPQRLPFFQDKLFKRCKNSALDFNNKTRLAFSKLERFVP